MSPSVNDLLPERLATLIETRGLRRFGRACRVLEACASTNDEAAAAAATGAPEGFAVVADAQTGGRGRLGRAWHSPPGENLYVSLLLRPALAPWALPPLTLVTGAALAATLARRGLTPTVKWPNDVLLPTPSGPRKAAGILTEMASDRDRIRHVVVGVGLNVNAEAFPPELAERATSLRLVTGHAHDRAELLVDFLSIFESSYIEALAGGSAAALAAWRSFAGLPRRVSIDRDGHVLAGEALDVDADGVLLVRDDGGRVHRVVSGDVVAE